MTTLSSAAAWREPARRLTHFQCLERILLGGATVSPIFGCPYAKTSCCLLDWLHIMDLGVAADCLGNVFKVLQRKMPGGSEAERVKRLFREVREFYDRVGTDCRLDELKPSMIQVKAAFPPTLRGKGGDIRALVPFAAEQKLNMVKNLKTLFAATR